MIMKNVKVFEDTAKLNQEAAEFIIATANKAVNVYGRFTIALCGGSTPKGLYELLATEPYRSAMPWEDTFVFWGDERYVTAATEDYNATLATKAMLSHVPIPEPNIFPVPTHLPLAEAADAYDKEIDSFFEGEAVFDLILLGVGEDGHTASLFPNSEALHEQDKIVVATTAPHKIAERITFTYPLINAADNVMFLVAGNGKADIMKEILNGEADKYPAQLVQPEGNLYWYLDRAAASKL